MMPKFTLSLAAATAALGLAALPAVSQAAPPRPMPHPAVIDWNAPGWNGHGWTWAGKWQTLEQRQAELNRRIDAGVRSGGISRSEEASLRSQFNAILRQEHVDQRGRGGLTMNERADLDRQFDALSMRIQHESNDRNNRPNG